MNKPKLYIAHNLAWHFLQWERASFARYFDIVDDAGEDTILFAFGPDAFYSSVHLPARLRIALLFPGYGFNPYHLLEQRVQALAVIEESYDIVFVNPGPIYEAFKESSKVYLCPFSIDTDLVTVKSYRVKLESLLHASADYPQKDWQRSREVMRLSGLKYEVYPSRRKKTSFEQFYLRVINKVRHELKRLPVPFFKQPYLPRTYKKHLDVVRKYQSYDGFVHVAIELAPHIDGKYTATLLEAGATGCIVFWHDTLNLGNDFETIFSVSKEPVVAAKTIQNIAENLNIHRHSQLTAQEIRDRCSPTAVMKCRYEVISRFL